MWSISVPLLGKKKKINVLFSWRMLLYCSWLKPNAEFCTAWKYRFFFFWFILLWKASKLYLFHWAALKWDTLIPIWQSLEENKYLCYFFLWIFQTIQKCDGVRRARCVWLQQLEHGWCWPATKQREQSWNSAAGIETLDSICHLCQGCYPHNDGKPSYSWSKKWNYIYSNQCCRWDAGLWGERVIMLQVWLVYYCASSVVDVRSASSFSTYESSIKIWMKTLFFHILLSLGAMGASWN